MSIRSSCRAPLPMKAVTASLVLALGSVALPLENPAFAQSGDPKKQEEVKKTKEEDKKQKEKTSAEDDAASTEDEKKKALSARDQQKDADPKTDSKAEEKKEFSDAVESKKAIYFSGDIGATRSDLAGLSNKTGFDRTVANGVLYGLSAGLRLKDLRLGVRWRVYDTTEFTLWAFALSAGYSLPLRPVTPVFSAHVGYVFDQDIQSALFRRSLPEGTILPPNVDVKGLLAGVDVNASYWITKFLRLGAFVGADLMFLSREKATVPASVYGPQPQIASNPLYSDSGSSVGINFNIGLRGAFDIGLE